MEDKSNMHTWYRATSAFLVQLPLHIQRPGRKEDKDVADQAKIDHGLAADAGL